MDINIALITFINCCNAALTGLTTYYYDVRQRRIKYYRWLKIYTILHNLLVLSLTPIFLNYRLFNSEYSTTSSLVKYSIFVSVILTTCMVTSTLLCRPQRERQLIKIILELNHLENIYFENWSSRTKQCTKLRNLDWLLYAKVLVSTCLALVEFFNGCISIIAMPNLSWIACTIYMFAMFNIASGVSTNYFIGLWHICTRYYICNRRLQQLVKQYKMFGSTFTLSAELLQVLVVYNKLTLLVRALNKTYKYQAFITLLLYFINNILTGYNAVLFCMSKSKKVGILLLSIQGGSYYFGILLDMFVFNSLCENILEACLETTSQVQQLTVMPKNERCLQRICEQTCLRFASDKVRMRILGLFEIDRRLWFSTMSNILLYTVFLLQSDYFNLEYFVGPEIFY